jgi:8-amino-7-oxononanoate synthase
MAAISKSPTALSAESFCREELTSLERFGLLRKLPAQTGAPGRTITLSGREALLLCSNNYLGLAGHERVKQAAREAIDRYGCGATGSRLISGNLDLYNQLETKLAKLKGSEAALVFNSGYQANMGAICSLVKTRDAIFCDSLNHASIIDACRLSQARVVNYRHCDADDLQRQLACNADTRRKLIVTESVFSMDGDVAPLQKIAGIAEKHGAMLMVDEAHATGVFGPNGGGVVQQLGLAGKVTIQMGTLSKALGSVGGYIAGSRDIISYLVQRARSFIFTTGLPPAALAASSAAVDVLLSEPGLRESLWRNVEHMRAGLADMGFDIGGASSQIIPLRMGDARLTMAACRLLLRRGVFVQGIRFPTVPRGTSRLRITPIALHTTEDIDFALAAFQGLAGALNSRRARLLAAARLESPVNTH